MPQSQINWSQQTLDELESFYWSTIAPERRRDGHDPDTEPPAYGWLTDHGYSGISYALREHHDLTVREFFVDVVGLGGGDSNDTDGYQWGIDNEETINQLDKYVRTLTHRRDLADTTIASRRTRIAKYARVYADIHGVADLVARTRDAVTETAEIQRALEVFDELKRELSSDGSRLRYLNDVSQFYAHLKRRGIAKYNPVSDFDQEYDWEQDEPDNPALDDHQVRQVHETAADLEEELLVLALCAWGLRPNEVASLHTSQLALEGDDPHIAFDERKNGPGTVALLYGLDALEERLITLGERETWNGYLFPSNASTSGHIVTGTVTNRFKSLAERADVRVRGGIPTPKMGRRFWYTAYNDAVSSLVDQLDPIAADQGSSDATVVVENYLSEAERRAQRREYMRERLIGIFETEVGA